MTNWIKNVVDKTIADQKEWDRKNEKLKEAKRRLKNIKKQEGK